MAAPHHEETLTASDFIMRYTLQELEAAIQSSRYCTYSLQHEELKGLQGEAALGLTQPVFSCRSHGTAEKPVGVCGPCMLRCHSDCDVVELHEKRQFQCDCPTTRSGVRCYAQAPSSSKREQPFPACNSNRRGHNFQARYCTCDGEYNAAQDTMHQCYCCDEWFHTEHIKGILGPQLMTTVSAMICSGCVSSEPFLAPFAQYSDTACSLTSTRDPGVATLQPWRCCLTCSEGADDGRGVCMHCATTCHAGHVLSAPRITEFYCDCSELLQQGGKSCGCAPAPVSSATTAPAAAAAPAGGAVAVAGDGPRAATDAGGAATTGAPPAPLWCAGAASPHSSHGRGGDGAHAKPTAVSAAIYLEDESVLLQSLCRCGLCMQAYGSARVATWFVGEMQDDDTHSVVDPETAAAVPTLLRHLQEEGEGASPTASSDAAQAHAGSSAGSAAADSAAKDQLAEKASAALSQLQAVTGFKTTYQQGLDALQALPATQQLDAIHGYSELSAAVMPWLAAKAAAGQVVTEADVREFFAGMQDRRVRPRMSPPEE